MRNRRRVAFLYKALTTALAVFLLVGALRAAGLFTSFEYDAADARARALTHTVDSDIVIVGIDARSLAELSEWPWPRARHAELIRQIGLAGPREFFIDIDFSSTQDAANDAALEAALADWVGPRIVLPAFVQHATATDAQLLSTRPLPRFAQHVDLASVNWTQAEDGLVRRIRPVWRLNGEEIRSVALVGSRQAVRLWSRDQLIDYSISPSSISFVSYVDVLRGRVDRREFAGKTVFVGATAVELLDVLTVPVYHSLPGVVVQALAAETLRNDRIVEVTAWGNTAILALWAAVCAFLFRGRSWRRNSIVLALSLAFIAGAWLVAFSEARVAIEIVPMVTLTALMFVAVTLRALDQQTWRSLAYSIGARRRGALLRSVVDSSHDCILCMDGAGIVQTANPAASLLFGCRSEDLIDAPIARFIPALPADLGELAGDSFEVLAGAISEWEARTPAGKSFPVELSISRVRLKERLYTTIVRDISERKAHQRKLEYQATHDPLTSLPNRAALNAHLGRVLDASGAGTAALLMLDLSRFKEVNDTLGHNVGDQVLCEVAQRFQRTLGSDGFLARIGGDEFTVVLSPAENRGAVERISQALSDSLRAPIAAGGVAIDVGVSIGIARYPQDSRDGDALLKYADVAMYVAKRRGATWEVYDAALDEYTLRKLTMVSELRSAIGTSELTLHYQPQINLHTGQAESAEALLRWKHPTLGAVSPGEFMAVAEATDLIGPLTEWTIIEALNQIRRWHQRGLDVRVAVNLSARILQDTSFPARLRTLLETSGVRPKLLELEITESAMMQDSARALAVLRQVHALDVMIAIDDYGSGFSSLAYLRDLPVHALKLDKSFVMNMRSREDDRVIVQSTAQLAHALGLQVVAEGVETEWEAQFLEQAGYDFGQGYHYNKAIPATECFAWMQQFNAAALSKRSLSEQQEPRQTAA